MSDWSDPDNWHDVDRFTLDAIHASPGADAHRPGWWDRIQEDAHRRRTTFLAWWVVATAAVIAVIEGTLWFRFR